MTKWLTIYQTQGPSITISPATDEQIEHTILAMKEQRGFVEFDHNGVRTILAGRHIIRVQSGNEDLGVYVDSL